MPPPDDPHPPTPLGGHKCSSFPDHRFAVASGPLVPCLRGLPACAHQRASPSSGRALFCSQLTPTVWNRAGVPEIPAACMGGRNGEGLGKFVSVDLVKAEFVSLTISRPDLLNQPLVDAQIGGDHHNLGQADFVICHLKRGRGFRLKEKKVGSLSMGRFRQPRQGRAASFLTSPCSGLLVHRLARDPRDAVNLC